MIRNVDTAARVEYLFRVGYIPVITPFLVKRNKRKLEQRIEKLRGKVADARSRMEVLLRKSRRSLMTDDYEDVRRDLEDKMLKVCRAAGVKGRRSKSSDDEDYDEGDAGAEPRSLDDRCKDAVRKAVKKTGSGAYSKEDKRLMELCVSGGGTVIVTPGMHPKITSETTITAPEE